MKIEDRTQREILFDAVEVGDVFKYSDGLYLKINPAYITDFNDDVAEDIEDAVDAIKDGRFMNAYDLGSHCFVRITEGLKVQLVKTTLVVE